MVHNNVQDFRAKYKNIVHLLVECRKSSGISGEALAEDLKVDRRKIMSFENLKKIDLELLLKYADKMSVDVRLNFEIT
jgi:transcriptional regulator with XRE-family HTH domain